MIVRSIVGLVFAMPASMILLGLILSGTPPIETLRMPLLLMVFPVWVVVATASFLLDKAMHSAIALIGFSLFGYGLTLLLKSTGVVGP